jgi:hypothetical protein
MKKKLKSLAEHKEQIRNTLAFLEKYRDGALLTELADAFAEATDVCHETKKPAKITISFGLRSISDDGAVEIGDVVDVKLPKQTKGTGIFYTTPNGAFTRSDPRQHNMELAALSDDDQLHTVGGMSEHIHDLG